MNARAILWEEKRNGFIYKLLAMMLAPLRRLAVYARVIANTSSVTMVCMTRTGDQIKKAC